MLGEQGQRVTLVHVSELVELLWGIDYVYLSDEPQH